MADERSVEQRMAELNALISEGKQLGVDTTELEEAVRNAEAARQNIVAAAQNQTDEAIADAESRLAQELADWETRMVFAEADLMTRVSDAANAHLRQARDADPNYSPAEAEARRAAERERFESESAAEAESFMEGVSSGASSDISGLDASAEDILRGIDEAIDPAINDDYTQAYTEDTGATADNIEDHFRERVAEYLALDMQQDVFEKALKTALPGELVDLESKIAFIEASKQGIIIAAEKGNPGQSRMVVSAAKQIKSTGTVVFDEKDEITPESLPEIKDGIVVKVDGSPELSESEVRRIERMVDSEMRDLRRFERRLEPLVDERAIFEREMEKRRSVEKDKEGSKTKTPEEIFSTAQLTADVAKLYRYNLEDSKNELIMDSLSADAISRTHDDERAEIVERYTSDYGMLKMIGADKKPGLLDKNREEKKALHQSFLAAQAKLDAYAHQVAVMEYLHEKVDHIVGQYVFEDNALYEVKRNGKKGKEIIKATDVGDEIFKGLPKDAKISPEQVEERLRQFAKNNLFEGFVEDLSKDGEGLFFGKHSEGDGYIYSAHMQSMFTRKERKEIEERYLQKREDLQREATEKEIRAAQRVGADVLDPTKPDKDPKPATPEDEEVKDGDDNPESEEEKNKKKEREYSKQKPVAPIPRGKELDLNEFIQRYSKFLTYDMQVEVCDMIRKGALKYENKNQKKIDRELKKKYKEDRKEKKRRDKETKREKSIFDKKTSLFKKYEQKGLLNIRKQNKEFQKELEERQKELEKETQKSTFDKIVEGIKGKFKRHQEPQAGDNQPESEKEGGEDPAHDDSVDGKDDPKKPKGETESESESESGDDKEKGKKEKTEKTSPIEKFLKGFIEKHEREKAAKDGSEKSVGDKLKEFGESVKSAVSQKAQEFAGNLKGLFEGRQGSDTPTNDQEEIIMTDGLGDVGITPKETPDPASPLNTGNTPTGAENDLFTLVKDDSGLYYANPDGTPSDRFEYSTPERADDGKYYYMNEDGTRGMEWRRRIQNENGVEHCEGTSEEFGYEPDDWVIGTNPETGEQGTYALHGDEIDYNRSLAEEHIPLGYRGIDPNNPQQQNDGAGNDGTEMGDGE